VGGLSVYWDQWGGKNELEREEISVQVKGWGELMKIVDMGSTEQK
jgi:hypothetical protein